MATYETQQVQSAIQSSMVFHDQPNTGRSWGTLYSATHQQSGSSQIRSPKLQGLI